jgi:hypothetical protein
MTQIHTKVQECSDIGTNVRKFLVDRAAKSHQTFLPFRAEKVQLSLDKEGITSDRDMYKTAMSIRNSTPTYMKPPRVFRKNIAILTMHTNKK